MSTPSTFIEDCGLSTLIVGILSVIIQVWVTARAKGAIQIEYDKKLATYESQLAKTLETHKAQLKSDSDIALAELEAKLRICAAERSIKLTKVFDTQADVILGTYSRLVALLEAAGQYTREFATENTPTKEARRIVVQNRFKELVEYYRPHKLFFKKEIQKEIEDFISELDTKLYEFSFYTDEKTPLNIKSEKRDIYKETWTFIGKECPKIMDNIDGKFKELLELHEKVQD